MSKQYLTTHTLDLAHPTDIFSLAVTPTSILSASGTSTLQSHSLTSSSFPHIQTLGPAHKLGCHHVCTSADGRRAVSVGFGGEVRVWMRKQQNAGAGRGGGAGAGAGARADGGAGGNSDGEAAEAGEGWADDGEVSLKEGRKTGDLWAPALSHEGQYLVGTTMDGKVNVWDLESGGDGEGERKGRKKVLTLETKGSFGVCCDMSHDSTHTASGHTNGSIYIFTNSTGKLLHSLPSIHGHVRSVRFSPASTLIAAAGDSRVIALFDAKSGEQVASLAGHQSWIMCLDWSSTGEWLASGSWDGSVRVWSVERRECVAVLRDAGGGGTGGVGKCIWALRWLPRVEGRRSEGFAVAGAGKCISFYREAAGS